MEFGDLMVVQKQKRSRKGKFGEAHGGNGVNSGENISKSRFVVLNNDMFFNEDNPESNDASLENPVINGPPINQAWNFPKRQKVMKPSSQNAQGVLEPSNLTPIEAHKSQPPSQSTFRRIEPKSSQRGSALAIGPMKENVDPGISSRNFDLGLPMADQGLGNHRKELKKDDLPHPSKPSDGDLQKSSSLHSQDTFMVAETPSPDDDPSITRNVQNEEVMADAL